MKEINAILTIALRDFTKLLRDRFRLVISFIFPIIFIGALGTSLQSNIGQFIAFNYLTFTFTGVLAQTLFQSTASGIISLIQDRESDFSQEMFVSPISRYSIIFGKILGESLVSLVQAVGVVFFGLFMGLFFPIAITTAQLLLATPAIIAACLLGGAFGVLVMAALGNQRSANQLFPFVIFPQFFLAGVFNPIKELPLPILVLSRLAPMTYAVDFFRGLYYWGQPDYQYVVLYHPLVNLIVISILFTVMLSVGTYLFVRNERNR
ncbi:MAG TPA: ABC transporter permease [Patescibacteria group bacterium]|nr:ABC transporter permease [Patescibacteria group bacterium]